VHSVVGGSWDVDEGLGGHRDRPANTKREAGKSAGRATFTL
jgi:hypothetical protein